MEPEHIPAGLRIQIRLARARTSLANERTLLSYLHTALAFLIGGVSLIKFFDDLWIVAVGVGLLLASGAVLVVGVYRYRRLRVSLVEQREPLIEESDEDAD